MTDLSQTIEAKSNQLNADDLMGGARTITVTSVAATSEKDQPIDINYEGDNGKPYKPCKSMRRVLVLLWGIDGKQYIGKSMTLYRDPEVVFGGKIVGGTRISHMSDISKSETISLTASKLKKAIITIQPLKTAPKPVEAVLSDDDFKAIEKLLTDATFETKDVALTKAREIYNIASTDQKKTIKDLSDKVKLLVAETVEITPDEEFVL